MKMVDKPRWLPNCTNVYDVHGVNGNLDLRLAEDVTRE
jgi:hypothetical protein